MHAETSPPTVPPLAPAPGTHAYRADVDGLRAIAVAAVVVYHAFPTWLPGGFAGVDVFFVISGFLITGSIRDSAVAGTFSVREFYARRVRRIFPALAVMLIATIAVGAQVVFVDEYKRLMSEVVNGAAFIANIKFWLDTGYFDVTAERKPLLHLWSLGIEEQFYFVWPLVLAVCLRAKSTWRHAWWALGLASFACCAWTTARHPQFAFYMLPARFWELAAGGALALSPRLNQRGPAWFEEILSVAGAALLAVTFGALDATRAFPGAWATLPVLGAVLVVRGRGSRANRFAWSMPGLTYLGRISYPLYLWHWPPLAFAHAVNGRVLDPWLTLTLVTTAVILSALTYHLVEKPYRFGRAKWISNWAPLGAVAVIAVVASVEKGTLWLVPKSLKDMAGELRYEQADHRVGDGRCPPELDGGDYISYCRESRERPAIALVGDSHAEHLNIGLVERFANEGVLTVGHGSCAPLAGVATLPECAGKIDRIVAYLAGAPHVRTVFVAGASFYLRSDVVAADQAAGNRLPEHYVIDGRVDVPGRSEGYARGLDRLVGTLIRAGKTVVLMKDNPEFPFFPRTSIDGGPPLRRWLKTRRTDPTGVDRDFTVARQADFDRLLDRIAAKHPGVVTYDPKRVLCVVKECPIRIDGRLLYRDSHHLSARGSRYVIEQLSIK